MREAATRFSSSATAKLARCLRSDVGASEPSRERAARGASMFLPTIRTSEPSAAAAAAASVFPRGSAKAHRIRSPSRRGEEEKPASSNGQLFCQQTRALLNRVVGTVHARPSLRSYTLKSLLNLISVLQSEGAASATATHSQIQNPVWNVNIGNGCSLNSKMLLQIQQTFECV